jgi:hypothetical protein
MLIVLRMCVYILYFTFRSSTMRELICVFVESPSGIETESPWRLRYAHGAPTSRSLSIVSHLRPTSFVQRVVNLMCGVICKDIALVSIPIHPPRDFRLQDLSLSADPRDMVAYPECLRCSKYRDYHKNHRRRVRFGCRLMLHNACWPAPLALSWHHVRLGAIPLEPGRGCGVASPALIAYIFPMKGSDLALLGNRRGAPANGQSDRCLTCPAFDSLPFFTVGIY